MTDSTAYNDAVDLLEHAWRTGDDGLLDQAVHLLRRLAAEPSADAAVLSTLGVALHQRYERSGDRHDLDDAVAAHRGAVARCADDHPDQVAVLVNLANMLRIRFDTTGQDADLEEAVQLNRRVAAIPALSPDVRVVVQTNLGLCLRIRFQATGAEGDMDAAIAACRQAVDAMPEGYLERAGVLANLAGAYQARYEHTGVRADLDQSIALGRLAASAGGAAAHRPRILSNLCGALQTRYEHTGDGGDLDEALDAGRAAVVATAGHDPGLPGRLANLSAAFLTRFDRTADPGDIEEAVVAARAAVDRTPEDDPGLGGRLSNLGAALRMKADQTGGHADLDQAIEVCLLAVRVTPEGHPRRAAYLCNLGNVLRDRFRLGQERAAADQAIQAYEQAVDQCPPGHPDLGAYLSNLAGTRFDLFERTHEEQLRAEAIADFRRATGLEGVRPRIRVATATAWGRVAADAGRWIDALAGLEQAITLLGLLAPRELGREDQERELARHIMIASDAAACALQLDDPGKALTLLEQGRGLLLGQAIDARTELTDLREHMPDLAERFDRICRLLDAPTPLDAAPAAVSAQRRRHAADFTDVVDRIRAVPRFARFLRPPALADLLPLAEHGPIVVVNVSELRSDALILTTQGVRNVHLPLLQPAALVEQVAVVARLDEGAGGIAEVELSGVLDWLWRAVAAPVLAELDLPAPIRLYWVATGLLTFLPLHAAQPADGDVGLLDLAICSSVPTLRALAHARSRSPVPTTSVLAIGAPPAPGQRPLPAARREPHLVSAALPVPVKIIEGHEATRSAVLTALVTHGWAHIACHAVTDDSSPSQSALVIPDADGRLLTVADIARQRLTTADLAYLSACATNRTAVALADEAIHITSAFQLAGYRHVIGTLWPIPDRLASRVMRDFYAGVTLGGRVDADRASTALHAALLALRSRAPHHPSAWAAYIHSGASG
ncbi:CHAT domain-containing protein [Acrocarpospora macrocephala]|uniref:CHAT domain-containing protein n=1 Tax=Acrocarpospora macrocephala TaxID=150177 RepID=A0A5M3WLD4_9ACTN|nr:CHAT domain-containing protein [Acrocarpospora macrocephala]GES07713.1 CHAT domain-containing protein [Acrocarpospora macrocephala]